MPKVFVFYGTREDMLDLLAPQVVPAGFRFAWLRGEGADRLAFAADASELPSPLPSDLCLCRSTSSLSPRTVEGEDGQRMVLTPRDVSDGLWLQLGKTDATARMVCESRLFILRDDPSYLAAFKAIGKAIRSLGQPGYCMGKPAPSTFVLPRAADLCRSGWRLNQHIRMPEFNDITL